MLRAAQVPVKMNKRPPQSWMENCKKNEKNSGSVEIKLRAEYNVKATIGEVGGGLSRQHLI